MSDGTARLAIVTGGSRGLGAAIVRALLEQQVADHVVVFDLDSGDESGPCHDDERVSFHRCDVTDEDSVQAAYAEVGTPQILVNNAGGGRLDQLSDQPDAPHDSFDPFGSVSAFRDMVDLNLTSAHVVTRVIGPDLEPGSVICNTASIAGQKPGRLFAYGAAKAGLIHWTQSMAKALATRQIRVNAVAPGIIRTRLWEVLQPDQDAYQAMIAQTMPLGRDQTPEDIAEAVAFLCSTRAAQITGEVIRIDGGFTLN